MPLLIVTLSGHPQPPPSGWEERVVWHMAKVTISSAFFLEGLVWMLSIIPVSHVNLFLLN